MAEKKAILVLNASADSLKKAALLPNADCAVTYLIKIASDSC